MINGILKKLFKTISFISELPKIERTVKIKVNQGRRFENDAEHSYQLAMVGWYLAELLKLKLNKDLVIKYALVHDLVEIYAGDTDPYLSNIKYLMSEKEREARALKRIKKEFKDFREITNLIEKYEKRADQESKFIYSLDKILPVMNVYLTKDKYYNQHGISLKMWIDHNKNLASQSLPIERIYKELVIFFKRNKSNLFAP